MTMEAFGETITLSVQVSGLALLYAGLIVGAVWRSSLAAKTNYAQTFAQTLRGRKVRT